MPRVVRFLLVQINDFQIFRHRREFCDVGQIRQLRTVSLFVHGIQMVNDCILEE